MIAVTGMLTHGAEVAGSRTVNFGQAEIGNAGAASTAEIMAKKFRAGADLTCAEHTN